ncbi:unnamed protein product [Protopolystoma xenopodis]|uniref:Uncharacterized protein n=1 Tax=Protopolystoma xenopodis TaxID=117903 RepID=A0A448WIH0_9PLAT|nr:unnamed protein product [Protopolystoma xenopodis]
MNPVIYAKFNREFRTPFRQILLCHCRSINARLRSETYAAQFGLPSSAGCRRRRTETSLGKLRTSEIIYEKSESKAITQYKVTGNFYPEFRIKCIMSDLLYRKILQNKTVNPSDNK